jgi:hypothetical protein
MPIASTADTATERRVPGEGCKSNVAEHQQSTTRWLCGGFAATATGTVGTLGESRQAWDATRPLVILVLVLVLVAR